MSGISNFPPNGNPYKLNLKDTRKILQKEDEKEKKNLQEESNQESGLKEQLQPKEQKGLFDGIDFLAKFKRDNVKVNVKANPNANAGHASQESMDEIGNQTAIQDLSEFIQVPDDFQAILDNNPDLNLTELIRQAESQGLELVINDSHGKVMAMDVYGNLHPYDRIDKVFLELDTVEIINKISEYLLGNANNLVGEYSISDINPIAQVILNGNLPIVNIESLFGEAQNINASELLEKVNNSDDPTLKQFSKMLGFAFMKYGCNDDSSKQTLAESLITVLNSQNGYPNTTPITLSRELIEDLNSGNTTFSKIADIIQGEDLKTVYLENRVFTYEQLHNEYGLDDETINTYFRPRPDGGYATIQGNMDALTFESGVMVLSFQGINDPQHIYGEYSLADLQANFDDATIEIYFEKAFGPNMYNIKSEYSENFSSLETLKQFVNENNYKAYEQQIILTNFMGSMQVRSGNDSSSSLLMTDYGILDINNFEQIQADEMYKLISPMSLYEMQAAAVKKVIYDFSSGNMPVSQIKLVLEMAYVENININLENGIYNLSFTYEGKQYEAHCEEVAAKSASDNITLDPHYSERYINALINEKGISEDLINEYFIKSSTIGDTSMYSLRSGKSIVEFNVITGQAETYTQEQIDALNISNIGYNYGAVNFIFNDSEFNEIISNNFDKITINGATVYVPKFSTMENIQQYIKDTELYNYATSKINSARNFEPDTPDEYNGYVITDENTYNERMASYQYYLYMNDINESGEIDIEAAIACGLYPCDPDVFRHYMEQADVRNYLKQRFHMEVPSPNDEEAFDTFIANNQSTWDNIAKLFSVNSNSYNKQDVLKYFGLASTDENMMTYFYKELAFAPSLYTDISTNVTDAEERVTDYINQYYSELIESGFLNEDLLENIIEIATDYIESEKNVKLIPQCVGMAVELAKHTSGVNKIEYIQDRLITFTSMKIEDPTLTFDEMNEQFAINIMMNSAIESIKDLYSDCNQEVSIEGLEDLMFLSQVAPFSFANNPELREAYMKMRSVLYFSSEDLTNQQYYDLLKQDLLKLYPGYPDMNDEAIELIKEQINKLSPEDIIDLIKQTLELPAESEHEYEDAYNTFIAKFTETVNKYQDGYVLESPDSIKDIKDIYRDINGVEFNADYIIEYRSFNNRMESFIETAGVFKFILSTMDSVNAGTIDAEQAIFMIAATYTDFNENEIPNFISNILGNNNFTIQDNKVITDNSEDALGQIWDWCCENYTAATSTCFPDEENSPTVSRAPRAQSNTADDGTPVITQGYSTDYWREQYNKDTGKAFEWMQSKTNALARYSDGYFDKFIGIFTGETSVVEGVASGVWGTATGIVTYPIDGVVNVLSGAWRSAYDPDYTLTEGIRDLGKGGFELIGGTLIGKGLGLTGKLLMKIPFVRNTASALGVYASRAVLNATSKINNSECVNKIYAQIDEIKAYFGYVSRNGKKEVYTMDEFGNMRWNSPRIATKTDKDCFGNTVYKDMNGNILKPRYVKGETLVNVSKDEELRAMLIDLLDGKSIQETMGLTKEEAIAKLENMSEKEAMDYIYGVVQSLIKKPNPNWTGLYNDNTLLGEIFGENSWGSACRHNSLLFDVFRDYFAKEYGLDISGCIAKGVYLQTGEAHAWNIVKINGVDYIYDTTLGIKGIKASELSNMISDYFDWSNLLGNMGKLGTGMLVTLGLIALNPSDANAQGQTNSNYTPRDFENFLMNMLSSNNTAFGGMISGAMNDTLASIINNYIDNPYDNDFYMAVVRAYSLYNPNKVIAFDNFAMFRGEIYDSLQDFCNKTGYKASLSEDGVMIFIGDGTRGQNGYLNMLYLPGPDIIGHRLAQPYTDSSGNSYNSLTDCIDSHKKGYTDPALYYNDYPQGSVSTYNYDEIVMNSNNFVTELFKGSFFKDITSCEYVINDILDALEAQGLGDTYDVYVNNDNGESWSINLYNKTTGEIIVLSHAAGQTDENGKPSFNAERLSSITAYMNENYSDPFASIPDKMLKKYLPSWIYNAYTDDNGKLDRNRLNIFIAPYMYLNKKTNKPDVDWEGLNAIAKLFTSSDKYHDFDYSGYQDLMDTFYNEDGSFNAEGFGSYMYAVKQFVFAYDKYMYEQYMEPIHDLQNWSNEILYRLQTGTTTGISETAIWAQIRYYEELLGKPGLDPAKAAEITEILSRLYEKLGHSMSSNIGRPDVVEALPREPIYIIVYNEHSYSSQNQNQSSYFNAPNWFINAYVYDDEMWHLTGDDAWNKMMEQKAHYNYWKEANSSLIEGKSTSEIYSLYQYDMYSFTIWLAVYAPAQGIDTEMSWEELYNEYLIRTGGMESSDYSLWASENSSFVNDCSPQEKYNLFKEDIAKFENWVKYDARNQGIDPSLRSRDDLYKYYLDFTGGMKADDYSFWQEANNDNDYRFLRDYHMFSSDIVKFDAWLENEAPQLGINMNKSRAELYREYQIQTGGIYSADYSFWKEENSSKIINCTSQQIIDLFIKDLNKFTYWLKYKAPFLDIDNNLSRDELYRKYKELTGGIW